MDKIFITGYSGNVGGALAKYLLGNQIDFVAGVRTVEKYQDESEGIEFRKFDIEDPRSFLEALKGINKVFLVRPPQITDVAGVFKPFIDYCKSINIEQLVFLSLLGVEKNPFPPHYKIEKLILASKIPYTFIRPSFFMQNLIEPHAKDIRELNEIFIPSGKAKISFIDTDDIGEIIGITLLNQNHINKSYTITGSEAIDYYHVAQVMSHILGRKIRYTSPGLLKFRRYSIENGTKEEYANVMTILYLTTKLGMARKVTRSSEIILGRKPTTITQFIEKNKSMWE